jgi:hypothetical protein
MVSFINYLQKSDKQGFKYNWIWILNLELIKI